MRLMVLLLVLLFSLAPATALVNPALPQASVGGAESTVIAPQEVGGGIAFPEALRMVVGPVERQWDAQLRLPTTEPVEEGDAIAISLWIRGGAETGRAGLLEINFEKAGEPYTKSLDYPIQTTPDWRKVEVRFRSAAAYEAGGAQVVFQLGFLPQWVEVAGLEAANLGGDADYEAIPSTPVTYPGRAADSAWRAEAAKRIEEHRMGALRIIVVDGEGRRLPGEAVRVVQQRHAFRFGTAVSVGRLLADDAEGRRYRDVLRENFNSATIENGLKWRAWEAGWGQNAKTQEALAWLKENGLESRGHVMVWPSWRYSPAPLEALRDQPETLRQRVLDHIAEIAGATRGYVQDWDVVNETFDNTDLLEILGRDEMVAWFKAAATSLPGVDLYYNDYAALIQGGLDTAHKRHFDETARFLIDGGAPVDGLGLQSHFGTLLTPPENLLDELDRWAAFGLKLRVTEFDVAVEDEALQADYTRDFLTALFSHPAVVGVSTWGFWAGAHWKPEAALWREDWSERSAALAWRHLVREAWWTDVEVTTDAQGEAVVRGFLGEYQIRVGERIWQADLPNGGGVVTVAR